MRSLRAQLLLGTVLATIAGTITGPGGIGLAGVEVQARYWNGSWWDLAAWVSTGDGGGYSLEGLSAGSYRVCFRDWSGQHVAESR